MNTVRRMRRIFRNDGRSLIVAMDHGTNAGVVPGLERPGETIRNVVEGGADAVIANIGLAHSHAEELAGIGLIARLDLPPTKLGSGHGSTRVFDARHALRVGADAVVVNGAPGAGVENETLPSVAETVAECAPWGLPVLGEMVPGGFDGDKKYRTLENLVLSARIASELGADFIKIRYQPGFEKVVEACFCPVVVLGGARTDDMTLFLSSIKDAVDQGASGVAIGRNIWGSDDPYAMTRALAAIIHDGADVDTAVALVKS